MNTNIINAKNIIRLAYQLCDIAIPYLGSSGTMQTWSGICGNVIVGDDGQHWIGDLCYMREKFGWSHDEYMQAYGYCNYPAGDWRDHVNLTDNLQVHTFRDKHILVIRTGSDGAGPLGLGLDTAAVSFVSTDRARLEAAAAACIAYLESKRGELEAAAAKEEAAWAAYLKHDADKKAAAEKFRTPGNTIIGTRTVADYAGGGYRGRAKFKTRTENVRFVIASASADYLTSTTGQRFKIDTLRDCRAFTPRQIGAQKAAATRQAARAPASTTQP